jgi:hypothetical protein
MKANTCRSRKKLHGDGRKRNRGHKWWWLLSLPLINHQSWMVHIVGEMGRGGVGTILIAAEGGGGGVRGRGGGWRIQSIIRYGILMVNVKEGRRRIGAHGHPLWFMPWAIMESMAVCEKGMHRSRLECCGVGRVPWTGNWEVAEEVTISHWRGQRQRNAGQRQRWRNAGGEKRDRDRQKSSRATVAHVRHTQWCRRKTLRARENLHPWVEHQAGCGNCSWPKKVTRPGIFRVTCRGTNANSGHLRSIQILPPQMPLRMQCHWRK